MSVEGMARAVYGEPPQVDYCYCLKPFPDYFLSGEIFTLLDTPNYHMVELNLSLPITEVDSGGIIGEVLLVADSSTGTELWRGFTLIIVADTTASKITQQWQCFVPVPSYTVSFDPVDTVSSRTVSSDTMFSRTVKLKPQIVTPPKTYLIFSQILSRDGRGKLDTLVLQDTLTAGL